MALPYQTKSSCSLTFCFHLWPARWIREAQEQAVKVASNTLPFCIWRIYCLCTWKFTFCAKANNDWQATLPWLYIKAVIPNKLSTNEFCGGPLIFSQSKEPTLASILVEHEVLLQRASIWKTAAPIKEGCLAWNLFFHGTFCHFVIQLCNYLHWDCSRPASRGRQHNQSEEVGEQSLFHTNQWEEKDQTRN